MGGLIHSDKDFAHFGHSVAKKLIQQFTTFQRKLPIIETSWQLGVVGKHWTANQEDTGSNPVPMDMFFLVFIKRTYDKKFPRDQLFCNKTNILCFES